MDDYISRQAAINAIEELNAVSFYELNEHSEEAYKDIKAAIRRISLADVRPVVRGHWLLPPDSYPFCSECGKQPTYTGVFRSPVYSDFCPHCGADMREEDRSE